MLEAFFKDTPNIEVWPTFHDRVLSQVMQDVSAIGFFSEILTHDIYDNDFRKSRGTGFVPINTVKNLLRLQLDGRPGDLLTDGRQNVFYCEPSCCGQPGFALQAQWLIRDYNKKSRWLVLGWKLTRRSDKPYNWGTFRPAGSKIFWR